LASQLSLEFTFSPEADGKRSERIAIDVKDASIEELLQELLSPLDLTFRLNEEQVHIDLAP
jgi:G:T-mismatch repair DNA endonuclease (very short patch repair protein)